MLVPASKSASEDQEQLPCPGGRWRKGRAIVLGALLLPLNLYFLLYMEVGFNQGLPGTGAGPYPSTVSLFGNAILFLVALTALNIALAKLRPEQALSQPEMLVIYVMTVVATSIVSIDFLDVLLPMIAFPFRAATPENRWEQILWPHLPSWLTVSDPEAVAGWYEGRSTLYRWDILKHWLIPLAVWSASIFVMLFVMFCINTVVRHQWIEPDRLQFPIVEVPMQITEPGHRLLHSRLTWIGFAIAGGISLMNGLHVFYPLVPSLPVKMFDIQRFFTGSPWNAIGWTTVSFYPYGIGLGFLLPLDMLFSCWFFYLAWRALRILGAVYGVYQGTPDFPYMNQQALGAYYLIGGMALWTGRKHLRQVWRSVTRGGGGPGEQDSPMRYRTAVSGAVLGTAALTAFFHLAGMRWWVAAAAVLLYLALALAIARMHAEFGPPAHDLHFIGPEMVLTGTLGSTAFPRSDLAALTWFWWFNRAYRSIPIAYQLDAMKISQRSHISQRYMGAAIALASVIAVVGGFWIYLHLGYERGAEAQMAGHVRHFGVEGFVSHFQNWVENPEGPDHKATAATIWGVLFAYFLYMAKLHAAWWPFHPLGFAVSTSYSISTLWLPLFIAWAAKLIALKTGGLRAYRKALDFFIGLILGDFVVGCLWPIFGWAFGLSTYSFMQ